MSGGLDFGVIIEMAKAMNIEINQTFFKKLRAYESTILSIKTNEGK